MKPWNSDPSRLHCSRQQIRICSSKKQLLRKEKKTNFCLCSEIPELFSSSTGTKAAKRKTKFRGRRTSSKRIQFRRLSQKEPFRQASSFENSEQLKLNRRWNGFPAALREMATLQGWQFHQIKVLLGRHHSFEFLNPVLKGSKLVTHMLLLRNLIQKIFPTLGI